MQFTRKFVSRLQEHFHFSKGHTKKEAGFSHKRTQILQILRTVCDSVLLGVRVLFLISMNQQD